MSIWGKIVGTAAGFAMGGPLGAMVGAAAGHFFDRRLESQDEQARLAGQGEASFGDTVHQMREQARKMAFTVAVVALGAKMAKADGVVTRDEVDAFKRVFSIPPSEEASVGRLFDQAKETADDFEIYARQAAMLFADTPQVLEDLLMALVMIAEADGEIKPAEATFLCRVSEIFGMSANGWQRLRGRSAGNGESGRAAGSSGIADPYAVLGVPASASDAEVKAAYRRLLRENHPDAVIAQGLPEEFVDVANRKMATINAAWDDVSRMRGLK